MAEELSLPASPTPYPLQYTNSSLKCEALALKIGILACPVTIFPPKFD